jgi:hypothetical protein
MPLTPPLRLRSRLALAAALASAALLAAPSASAQEAPPSLPAYTADGQPVAPETPSAQKRLTDDALWSRDFYGLGVIGGTMGIPVNSRIAPMSWDATGALVVAGRLTYAGGTPVNGIARWDGNSWDDMGGGLGGFTSGASGPYVMATVRGQDGSVYVGGSFASIGGVSARNIARWDGERWRPLGEGVGSVNDLAIAPNGDLIAGGQGFVQRWNGSSWTYLGGSGTILAVAVGPNGDVYAAGQFTSIGSTPATRIARWDGSTWHPLGSGLSGSTGLVMALAIGPGGHLYAAGMFNDAGGVAVRNVARWDGTQWHSLAGNGLNNYITVVHVTPDGRVLVGGNGGIVGEGNATVPGLWAMAAWDGEAWSSVGGGVNLAVSGFASDPATGSLIVGGNFGIAGHGDPALRLQVQNLARWDGSAWHALDPRPPSLAVPALGGIAADARGQLYASGRFELGGQRTFLARWDGGGWEPVPSPAMSLTASPPPLVRDREGNLYAWGAFNPDENGQPTSRVARFDGSTWHDMSAGLEGRFPTSFVAHSPRRAYGFAQVLIDGVVARLLFVWDGETWTTTPVEADNNILYLAALPDGDLVVAGGPITTIDGVAVDRVARWRDGTWYPMGSGIDGNVSALAVGPDGALYAAGWRNFNQPDDEHAFRLSRLDGDTWTPITGTTLVGVSQVFGVGFDSRGRVYAGVSGGIVRGDGNSWDWIAQGTDGAATSLLEAEGSLWVRGGFSLITPAVQSAGLARWYGLEPTPRPALLGPAAASAPTLPRLTWTGGVYAATYAVQLATDPAFADVVLTEEGLTATSLLVTTPLEPGRAYYWRVRDSNALTVQPWSEARTFTTVSAPSEVATVAPGSTEPVAFPEAGVEIAFEGLDAEAMVIVTAHPAGPGEAPPGLWFAGGTYWTIDLEGATEFSAEVCFALAGLGDLGDLDNLTIARRPNPSAEWAELSASLRPEAEPTHVCATSPGFSDFAIALRGRVSNEPTPGLPARFELAESYPNPFAQTTTIRFALAEAAPVTVVAYDLLGREVARLLDGEPREAGWHETIWTAEGLAAGVYVVRLTSGGFTGARRVLLAR